MILNGIIQKLKSRHKSPIEYQLPIGNEEIPLNSLLGKVLELEFSGNIFCIHCNRKTNKSFQQGYCFVCARSLARCDICIVRPEKCHHHLGTCREPNWAETHCFIPHCIYLANTSGLKVGITRETQIPTRWIDQGASQALKIARVTSRYHAGLVETTLTQHFADKTDWRAMLKAKPKTLDLSSEIKILETLNAIKNHTNETVNIDWLKESSLEFEYPVLQYPEKVKSISFEKTPKFSSVLLGIKGQYLIFEAGVLNVRNLSGFDLSITI